MNKTTKLGLTALQIVAAAGLANMAAAQGSQSGFQTRVASVTYGPYLRTELGYGRTSLTEGYWQPPGYDADPEVQFALSGDDVTSGVVAFGFDWQNGFRADVGLVATGTSDLSGLCSSASNGTSCDSHADIGSASVSTTGLMAHVFYAPLEERGSNSPLQPFVSAGLGVARNTVGDWTRVNPTATQASRTFSGDKTSSLAWSAGAGLSYQVTKPGEWPVIVEASVRYYDFGSASGGAVPLAGSGTSEPVTPLTFDFEQTVIAVGIRIPLKRY